MDLPQDLNNTLIKEKSVFYFSSEKISTTEPHYFIVLKNIDNIVVTFSCCTKQHQTISNYIKRNGYSMDTMASPDYNKYSFLKSPTFVNCNSKIEYPYDEFVSMTQSKKVKYVGDIDNNDYKAIIDGVLISEDIEEEFKAHLTVK